ncbi:hypothetical protein [Amycolatopsis sp. cmx-4-83]|uniref:hypothetical protein n=1 Tax=Amycolatopsis sp. cmx-4-83 TaxID=2790940 RepID=UPI003979D1A1
MGVSVAERPTLSLHSARARLGLYRRAPRYIVVPEHVWLGQPAFPEVDEERAEAGPVEEYYYRHPERPPLSQATATTLGGVTAAVVAGLAPGMLIAGPAGLVAGVAAGLFGGLMGRELAGELHERRHGE